MATTLQKAYRLHDCDKPLLAKVYDNGEIKNYRDVVQQQDYRVYASLGYGMIVESIKGFSAIILENNRDCGYAVGTMGISLKYRLITEDRKKKCSGVGYMWVKDIVWEIKRIDDYDKKVYLIPHNLQFAVGYDDMLLGRIVTDIPIDNYKVSFWGYMGLAFSIGLLCGSLERNTLVSIIAPIVVFLAIVFIGMLLCTIIPLLSSRVQAMDEDENKDWYGRGYLNALFVVIMIVGAIVAYKVFLRFLPY